MFKKISVLILSLLLLAACNNNSEDNKYNIKDPKNTLKNVTVDIQPSQILFDGENLSFDLYLARPDLKIKEPDYEKPMALTVDLPLGLQPRLMYAGAMHDEKFDNGFLCDRPRFPHRCEQKVAPTDTNYYFMIKIVFEDDTYAERLINIVIPPVLAKSEITFPTEEPTQGSTLKMSFADIGADEYKTEFRLCRPYENDGINPCLDGERYILSRVKGKWKITNDTSVYPISISEKDNIITIQSTHPIFFQESAEYLVTAIKNSINGAGIPVITSSTSSTSFPKN